MFSDLINTTVEQLQQHVTGRVITPQDADYDQVRHGHNLSIDHYPTLILVPATTQDIAAGVRYANHAGLPIAVQATGHGIPYPADDSLLIVTTQMRGVKLNLDAQTARVEAGAVWQDVLDVVIPHGLAPLLGSSPHVGVVGYTLGGGIGYLGRKYGFAADSMQWIELVTADGELRRASASENSDLFWGLRGGGGNFGVITAMEFSLYPVANFYAGNMTYPGEMATDALRFYRDWVQTLPDEMTTSIAIGNFPNSPQLPDAIRGKTLVLVRGAYTGDPQKGKALVQQWLDWRTPMANTFRNMPFAEVATISNDPVNPIATHGTNMQFDELTNEAIDIIVRRATDKTSNIVANELRHVGGAIRRVPADSNAISNREAHLFFQIGTPVFDLALLPAIKKYMKAYQEELQPFTRGGIYFNLMAGSEIEGRAKDVYGGKHYERLLALKAKYDPENRFCFSVPLVGKYAQPA